MEERRELKTGNKCETYKGNRKSYQKEVTNKRNAENSSQSEISEVMDENGKSVER